MGYLGYGLWEVQLYHQSADVGQKSPQACTHQPYEERSTVICTKGLGHLWSPRWWPWVTYHVTIPVRCWRTMHQYMKWWPRLLWPVNICSIGLLKSNWTKWVIFSLHLKEMGASCSFGHMFYLFPSKGHPSSRWNEAFEESVEEISKWKLKQTKTSSVELT